MCRQLSIFREKQLFLLVQFLSKMYQYLKAEKAEWLTLISTLFRFAGSIVAELESAAIKERDIEGRMEIGRFVTSVRSESQSESKGCGPSSYIFMELRPVPYLAVDRGQSCTSPIPKSMNTAEEKQDRLHRSLLACLHCPGSSPDIPILTHLPPMLSAQARLPLPTPRRKMVTLESKKVWDVSTYWLKWLCLTPIKPLSASSFWVPEYFQMSQSPGYTWLLNTVETAFQVWVSLGHNLWNKLHPQIMIHWVNS